MNAIGRNTETLSLKKIGPKASPPRKKESNSLPYLSHFINQCLGPFSNLLEEFLSLELDDYCWPFIEVVPIFTLPCTFPKSNNYTCGLDRIKQIIVDFPPKIHYSPDNLVIFVLSSSLRVINTQILVDFIGSILPDFRVISKDYAQFASAVEKMLSSDLPN